jgi:hypothetical protein
MSGSRLALEQMNIVVLVPVPDAARADRVVRDTGERDHERGCHAVRACNAPATPRDREIAARHGGCSAGEAEVPMKAIAPIVFFAAAVLYATAADAAGARYYTALGCQVAYNEGEALYSPDEGALYSLATTWWRTVLCPIPPGPNGVSDVAIWVVDNNPNLTMACRIGYNEAGGAVSWFPFVYFNGNGAAWLNTSQLPNNKAYFVWCSVPQVYNGARSGIKGLMAYEN